MKEEMRKREGKKRKLGSAEELHLQSEEKEEGRTTEKALNIIIVFVFLLLSSSCCCLVVFSSKRKNLLRIKSKVNHTLHTFFYEKVPSMNPNKRLSFQFFSTS